MKSSPLLATKNRLSLITQVDRAARYILSWKVAWERSQALIQSMVDEVPKAKQYFSDGFDVYASLWYHFGRYGVSQGKTDTYSVEGDNAELRYYLACLAPLSRCFSRRAYLCLGLYSAFVCLLFQSKTIEEVSPSQIHLSHY